MSVWKFQLYPAQPDRISKRFAMDAAAQAFESRVNAALRYPFAFHKVNKLCICLGPSTSPRADYREQLGVADRHYPDFSYSHYLSLSPDDRTQELERITKDVFAWFHANFDDANFVLVGAKNLGWSEFPEPQPKARRRTATTDA
jgi:hypothetical protein